MQTYYNNAARDDVTSINCRLFRCPSPSNRRRSPTASGSLSWRWRRPSEYQGSLLRQSILPTLAAGPHPPRPSSARRPAPFRRLRPSSPAKGSLLRRWPCGAGVPGFPLWSVRGRCQIRRAPRLVSIPMPAG